MDVPEVRFHAVALVFVERHPGIEDGVGLGFLEFMKVYICQYVMVFEVLAQQAVGACRKNCFGE